MTIQEKLDQFEDALVLSASPVNGGCGCHVILFANAFPTSTYTVWWERIDSDGNLRNHARMIARCVLEDFMDIRTLAVWEQNKHWNSAFHVEQRHHTTTG